MTECLNLSFKCLFLGLIIFNWLMLAFFCIYWIRQYDPLGKSLTHPNLNDEDEIPITARSSQWERRCRFLGCCAWNEAHSEEIQDSYTEIGSKRIKIDIREDTFIFLNGY